MAKTPAWQRAEGKNPKGGLNAKGRAAYNRANPGKPGLKAPQPEGGPRRDSFCARMKGMKKKLTSAETARDPNSRINKSLRAWNCAEGGMIKKMAKGGLSTAEGRGRPKDLEMARVDRRMSELDKYRKDPNLEMVFNPKTQKFQFREKRKPTPRAEAPAAPTPKKPKLGSNAVAGSGSGDRTPRGGGSIPTSKVRRNPNAVAGAGTGDRTPRGGGFAPTSKPKTKLNPNAVAGAGAGDRTPRGGSIPTPVRTRANRVPGARGKPRTGAGSISNIERPLSEFTGSRIEAARPTGMEKSTPLPRDMTGVNQTPIRGRDIAGAVAKGGAEGLLMGMGPGALRKLLDKGLLAAANKPLTQAKLSQMLGRARPGEVVPSEAELGASRFMDTFRSMGLKRGGLTNNKVATVMREFKAGKLHSGKSKKIVKNPKQAVAIALSEGRKAARKK